MISSPFFVKQSMDFLALSSVAVKVKQPPFSSSALRWSTGSTGQAIQRRRVKYVRLAVVCASGKKKNNDPASSGNEDSSLPGGNNKNDSKKIKSTSDWREFRANLVAHEENILLAADPNYRGPIESQSGELDPMWAHPISMPEPGCLLVATEKIDEDNYFSRSVILLLSLGSQYPSPSNPIGIILNRPLEKLAPNSPAQNSPAILSNHPLHFGGPLNPLQISTYLVKTEAGLIGAAYQSGMEKVINGVYYGGRDRIGELSALVKGGVVSSNDFKFFQGYSGWVYEQLLEEIDRGYWVVAAGSSRLIGRAVSEASDRMWQEVLQIMGGQYEEMSHKPKPPTQDEAELE